MSGKGARAETPEERNARLTPPPFSPTYRDGFPWVRSGDQVPEQPVEPVAEAPSGVASESASGDPSAAEPAGEPLTGATAAVPAEPVTARDVAESAMRAVAEVDAAIASLQAMKTQLLAGIAGVAIDDAIAERLDPDLGLRDVAAELALLQRRSDRTLQADLNHARTETSQWPATVRAWGEASIHRGHVAVIAEIGAAIQDSEARAAFEAALLPHAATVNPARLRALARRELEQHLDQPLAARHAQARDRRNVTVRDCDDGMSLVQAYLPTILARAGYDRLTQMAKAAPADDPRGYDQRRADAFADLFLTGEPTDVAIAAIRPDVSVIMPAPVLTSTDITGRAGSTTATDTSGDSSGPASSGTGAPAVARLTDGTPIDPETARELAARATSWTRLFTDPLTGHVTAVDTYVPSARLKKLLRARDQRCRWPGCTARAMRCDIDHTIPWADGGPTDTGNLAHLCRRHHMLKGTQLSRARRWKVRQLSPGVLEFTSPMGHTYIDRPPPTGPTFDTREHWGSHHTAAVADAPF